MRLLPAQVYTAEPRTPGYAPDIRRQAIQLYVNGISLRRIARHLGVVHQTVANWAATLPETPPLPTQDPQHPLAVVELDELYTFEGSKKRASSSSRR